MLKRSPALDEPRPLNAFGNRSRRGQPVAAARRARADRRAPRCDAAVRPLAVVLAVVLLATAGCGDQEQAETTPPPPGTSAETVTSPQRDEQMADTARCTNDQAGYSIEYPADWHTNADEPPTCTYFDPEPIELPERPRDVAGLAAISIRREPVAFSRVTGQDRGTRVIERAELEIARRPAVRRLIEATGQALLPEGRRSYQYLVNLDGQTLIATADGRDDRDFDANRELLDEMMRTLELKD